MAHPFPKRIEKDFEKLVKVFTFYTEDKKLHKPEVVLSAFSQSFRYGFTDNVRTGVYAAYYYEHDKLNLSGSNCTTVVPTMYVLADMLGLQPQIVQFAGFRDMKKGVPKDTPKDSASHFALMVDGIKEDTTYLLDPYWKVFGPIRKKSDGVLHIGKSRGYAQCRREYDSMEYISAKDFRALMNRMRTPAGSLEMLMGTQRIKPGDGRYKALTVGQNISYDDESNTLSTRLYHSQQFLADRVIHAHHHMTDEGSIERTTVELFTAKDSQWADLIGGRLIASADFSVYRKMRTALRRVMRPEKYERVLPALEKNPDIYDFVEPLMDMESFDAIRAMVLARTIYEGTSPHRDHINSIECIEDLINSRIDEDDRLRDQVQIYKDLEFRRGWKLLDIDKKERSKLRREQDKLTTRKGKVIREIDFLNITRKHNRPYFIRHCDKMLFAQGFAGASVDDLSSEVDRLGLDPRLGYVAIVTEYLPLMFDAKKAMFLEKFMDSIGEKVKARRAMKTKP